MTAEQANIKTLRSTILDEIFFAFGLGQDGWARRTLWPLAWLPAHVFSNVGSRFDAIVNSYGLTEAARRIMPRFASGFQAFGSENIPSEGPLLLAANHPGAIDSLVVAASVHRSDFKIVVSNIPFLRNLPATARYMIYATRDTYDRMNVLRAAVRHLEQGGAMLIFPSGSVDPDPGVLPGAEDALNRWSRSVELFMRKVPQTQLLVTIISNVLAHRFVRSPLVKVHKGKRERQKAAEFLQVMQQMVLPGSVDLLPRISFDRPTTLERLQSRMDQSLGSMVSIVERARMALKAHMAAISGKGYAGGDELIENPAR